jgi:putative phage-type endonuclease
MTLELQQGSEAWLKARLGRVTASRVADVVAKTKSGYAASRANYMAELITERLTGVPAERFQNDAMRWGTEKEPEARAAYEFLKEVSVEEVGFVPHPRIAMTGASPDGLVGLDGMVEFKCPNTATHIETLLGESVPGKYVIQTQWQMACADRQWCDFGSFDPRLPHAMQLWIRHLPRDETHIRELEAEVEAFLVELEDKLAKLRGAYGLREAA